MCKKLMNINTKSEIVIKNPCGCWPKYNMARFLIVEMIANEHQFEVITGGERAFISFYKGMWQVKIVGQTMLEISDDGTVREPGKETMTMDVAFLKEKIESWMRKSEDKIRRPFGEAIYNYLEMTIPGFLDNSDVKIITHKPYRDGFVSDMIDLENIA